MNLPDLIAIMKNKIATLERAKDSAWMAGDIVGHTAIEEELQSTKTTVAALERTLEAIQTPPNT
jgi:hypothetical protein